MPAPDFFRRCGLFVAPTFLDATTCARLRADICSSAQIQGTVGLEGARYAVDRRVRRVVMADIGDEPTELVRSRVMALKPDFETHFSMTLTEFQRPQFLRYAEGDFYARHRDRNPDSAAALSTARRVSVVIFLNDSTPAPAAETYGGGALTFYGLMGDGTDHVGFPLDAELGLLIAFPADLPHAVAPVTHGERFTVAGWFA
jgi:SM-20-related protein